MKINPCPFCGSSDVIVRHDENWFPAYTECDSCGCIGPKLNMPVGTIEAAGLCLERKWNTRTGTDLASVHAEIIARLNLLEQMLCKDDAKDAAGINTHLRNAWWLRDSINEYFASRSWQSSATPPTAPCPPPSEAPEA
jgi:hypothetical protein